MQMGPIKGRLPTDRFICMKKIKCCGTFFAPSRHLQLVVGSCCCFFLWRSSRFVPAPGFSSVPELFSTLCKKQNFMLSVIPGIKADKGWISVLVSLFSLLCGSRLPGLIGAHCKRRAGSWCHSTVASATHFFPSPLLSPLFCFCISMFITTTVVVPFPFHVHFINPSQP